MRELRREAAKTQLFLQLRPIYTHEVGIRSDDTTTIIHALHVAPCTFLTLHFYFTDNNKLKPLSALCQSLYSYTTRYTWCVFKGGKTCGGVTRMTNRLLLLLQL